MPTQQKRPLSLLLAELEEQETAPLVPAPKQRLPGWVRWPLRVLLVPWILLDLAAQRIARWVVRPPYKMVGQCKKRGTCCHYILIPEAKGIVGRLNLFVQTEVNGFFMRDTEPQEVDGKRMLIMGCRYLKRDGSCSHYHLRPSVCRSYPHIEIFGRPRVLKGCGFRATPRNDD